MVVQRQETRALRALQCGFESHPSYRNLNEELNERTGNY